MNPAPQKTQGPRDPREDVSLLRVVGTNASGWDSRVRPGTSDGNADSRPHRIQEKNKPGKEGPWVSHEQGCQACGGLWGPDETPQTGLRRQEFRVHSWRLDIRDPGVGPGGSS